LSLLTADWKSLIVVKDDRGVVHVTLNVPDKRNALSAVMIDELTQVAAQLSNSAEIRAVVLKGSGSVFCAGGDLSWMQTQIKADRTTRIVEAKKLAMMLHAWNTLPKPVIGSVHGGAYGGGAGLCCVCDVAVATRDTRFGFTETKLGLIPATISPYVLARLGEGRARRVFMSARLFDAEEAVQIGLIAKAVDAEQLNVAVEQEVEPYLHTAPVAVGAAKQLARSLGPVIDESAIDESINRLADSWETDEAAVGIDAFLNRTQPPWS